MRLLTAQPITRREWTSASEIMSAIGPRALAERQIQRAHAGPDVANIGRPFLVRSICGDATVQANFSAMLKLSPMSVPRRGNDPPDHPIYASAQGEA